jgi:hypothetical protein
VAKRSHPVYLEIGAKRVFAAGLDWPGWCRSGRDEGSALEALVAFGPRYRAALGKRAAGFLLPPSVSDLDVVERLKGNATTDFGAPAIAPSRDDRPVTDRELDRLNRLLRACWAAFDRTAKAAGSAVLAKGPRGGGRDLGAIVAHVLDAERAYLSRLGGTHRASPDADVRSETTAVRRAFVRALKARAHGELEPAPRRRSPLWLPRYAVRRSAWHALDHAWEIEDRASADPTLRRS